MAEQIKNCTGIAFHTVRAEHDFEKRVEIDSGAKEGFVQPVQ